MISKILLENVRSKLQSGQVEFECFDLTTISRRDKAGRLIAEVVCFFNAFSVFFKEPTALGTHLAIHGVLVYIYGRHDGLGFTSDARVNIKVLR